MIRDEDPRSASMKGGYRVPHDPRHARERLRVDGNDSRAWDDLWQNLHHQGDLGEASYVSVVALVEMCETTMLSDADLFGLVSTIEIERPRRTNPEVPEWLASDYRVRGEVVVCLAKGLPAFGAVLRYHDQHTRSEYLDERLAWTRAVYEQGPLTGHCT